MQTKYDVGETVLVPGIVKKIEISNNGTAYQVAPEGFSCTELGFREDEIYGSLCEEEGKKHGSWILLDECANAGVYCSVCHKKVYKTDYANQRIKSKYCPNCGARMDLNGGKII